MGVAPVWNCSDCILPSQGICVSRTILRRKSKSHPAQKTNWS